MKICKKLGHEYADGFRSCPICNAEAKRKWKEVNKDRIAETCKKWRASNPDRYLEAVRRWQRNNKDRHVENGRKYQEANRERVAKYKKNYEKERRANNSLFKLSGNIRNLIRNSFNNKGWSKATRTQSILGCDFVTLEAHLISTALKNYGYWLDCQEYHIDHIIPVSSATTEEELLKLNHYTNLQYLTPEDNLKKSNNAPETTR